MTAPALIRKADTSAQAIASKVRRALRNETGITLTAEQIRELVAQYGLLESLARAEITELCHAKQAPASSETIGSTSAAMGSRPMSGRSGRVPRGGVGTVDPQ